MQGSKPGGRGPSGTASTAEPIVAQVPRHQRRRRDVAPLAVRGCSGALHKSVEPDRSPRSARVRPPRASASCPPSPTYPWAMPRRGAPVQHVPAVRFPFPLRLSPHRTVSPRSGPSTSPRRMAWSRRPAARQARRPGAAGCSTCRSGGWRGAAGPATWEMTTMRRTTTLVALATFPSFPFLFSLAWCRKTASKRRRRCRNVWGVGWGRSLSALALESQRLALAHHSRRRSMCGGEARDGRVGQQINVRRGRVIPLGHVGKLQ